MSIKKVLEEHGVKDTIRGGKKTAYRQLASELRTAKPEDHERVLTKHGARLVLEAKGRVSYKELCRLVILDAERTMAIERRQHRVQLESAIGRRLEQEDGNGAALDGPGESDDDTAGN